MEALIFCSRRFRPGRGVPFKGYARKRIHEASCDASRKSKGWHKAGSSSATQQAAREISMDLIDIFPELRSGSLPMGDGDDDRGGIRNLLVGASMIAARHGEQSSMDDILDCRKVLSYIAELERVHQVIMWKVYWEGMSMRAVATDWETDELNVIREHKSLVDYLAKCISRGKALTAIRVRPGLKQIAAKLNKTSELPPFTRLLQ
jgi:DNA-directed RNA polymerase specialized sigma subunit